MNGIQESLKLESAPNVIALTGTKKERHKIYMRKWSEENREKTRAWNLRWKIEHPDKVKQYREEWAANNKDKVRLSRREQKEKNRDKVSAYNKVYKIRKRGALNIPGYCSVCGEAYSRLEGHHVDYSKPILLTWLCSKCHKDLHRSMKNE